VKLHHDLAILLLIGLIGAFVFVLNYKLIRKTRWGGKM
jgi:hypothetical protein